MIKTLIDITVIASVVILWVLIFIKVSKINILNQISQHFYMFYNDSTKKKNDVEIFLIFVAPMIISFSIRCFFGLEIVVETELITITSILSGLMLNMLLIILGLIEKESDLKLKQLTKETYYAVVFEIITGIILLIVLIVSAISSNIFNIVIEIILYYLLIIYFLNLLIVLKRVFAIFDYKLNYEDDIH